MFESVDHIGIATADIDKAIETLAKVGPITLGKEEVIEAFGVKAVMVAAGSVPIEFVQPLSDDSGVGKFLKNRGEGVHHIAYRVSDINAALETLKSQGFRLIDEKPREGYAGALVAFVHPKSVLGTLTELVQRESGKDVAPYDPA